jgi:hypothetical protein
MTDRNSGENTDGRNPDGTFSEGNTGKPKGAQNRATRAVQDLLEEQTEALTQAAVNKALEGDTAALRLCLERICPPRKDTPISFNFQGMKSASGAATTAGQIVKAVSQCEMTPFEGASVVGLVDSYRRAIETSELEKRLEALETK